LLVRKLSNLVVKQNRGRGSGELTFESDSLVEGGCLDQMHNGTNYREVREFRSTHHRVRFYFVTRVFSRYMSSVLEDLRADAPDVVLVNSCIWDISRYKAAWEEDYAEDLHLFLGQLKEAVPRETLVVWNLTMPLGRRVLGGFLTPEVASRAGTLRYDVVEANFIGGALADAYGADVLDMHFHFRLSLQQRTKDGVHWNALAHRRMTCLILGHAAEAWGVQLPPALPRTRTAFGTWPAGGRAILMGIEHGLCFSSSPCGLSSTAIAGSSRALIWNVFRYVVTKHLCSSPYSAWPGQRRWPANETRPCERHICVCV
uniref:PC-esterase domain-containing protein 1A-like n=1 Tax=Gadus morhua TaxID=8049 RepID=A0A8C4ZAH7_GADMO